MEIGLVTFLVKDYDEAVAFFCDCLGFDLLEDVKLSDDKRWVRVAPQGAEAAGAALLLAKASTPGQHQGVGRQAGGRVAYFLYTESFDETYAAFSEKGVRFCETPRQEAYGKVAVFEDLYGNKWDLLEKAKR